MTSHARIVALVLLAVAACSAPTPSPSGPPPSPLQGALAPPVAREYPGDPWTFQGQRVPPEVIALTLGPKVCGYGELVLVTMGKVLGKPALTSVDARQYVRDPANKFDTIGRFEASSKKPSDAVFSGYSYGSMELWTSEAVGTDTVFMARDGVWERWPRAREEFACAA
jgi:hypothetical protein